METPNFNKYKDIVETQQYDNNQQQMQVVEQKNNQLQSNPFEQYQTIGMPDVPLQYSGGMTETLLGDTEVPEAIKRKFWFIFNKDNVLTFLDEDRKKSKMLNLDITKIDMLNQMPYYQYDFTFEKDWNILRNAFETKLDRALGTKNSQVLNERKALQSQFSESKQIQEDTSNGPVADGFFRRLLGRK